MAALALHCLPIKLACVPVGIEGPGKIEANGCGPVEVEMLQFGVAFLPIDLVIGWYPPSHIDREFVLFKPLPPLRQRLTVRSVVGERRHRFQVVPEAEGHRDLRLLWRGGEAGRKLDVAPRIKPCSHVPNGACVKSVAGLGCPIHARSAVHKSPNLRAADRLTQDSYGHECEFGRHGEQCSKAVAALSRCFVRIDSGSWASSEPR